MPAALLPRKRRYIALQVVHAMMVAQGQDISMRTLERWCRQGKIPAKKSLSGYRWWVDLRSLKADAILGGRSLYEDMVDAVHQEAAEAE